MNTIKSVKVLSDVTCKNCTCYWEGRCYLKLPVSPVDQGSKCVEGGWLYQRDVVNFHTISWELRPFPYVTGVEDLICKNCVFYDAARKECHHKRLEIFKSEEADWCSRGWWFPDEDSSGILSFIYPKLIGKNNEKRNSNNTRAVKSLEILSDATCQNCISYNKGRCCYDLPFIPVGPENKCHKGEWLHEGQLLSLYGLCGYGVVREPFVKNIQELTCRDCIFYDVVKEECHYYRETVYKSGPDDWCGNGEWIFQNVEEGSNSGSLNFLYPILKRHKDCRTAAKFSPSAGAFSVFRKKTETQK